MISNSTDTSFRVSRWLPRKFRDIPLNAAMVAKLTDMGIDYDPDTGMRTDGQLLDEDE